MLTRCEHVVPGTEHVVVGSEKKKKLVFFFLSPRDSFVSVRLRARSPAGYLR